MNDYPFSANKMCSEFYELFNDLLKYKDTAKTKKYRSFIGRLFIFKNKFLKLFRDKIYLSLKAFAIDKIKGKK